MGQQTTIDRLAMRTRPEGSYIMEQNWENLLFLHWPIAESLLRPLIPAALEIDTFENSAWIGITPFRLSGLRIAAMPPIPGLNSFNEINVRTYVHHHGNPGIWFLSLDASKMLPALGARLFFQLPYHSAEIDFTEAGGRFCFDMKRTLKHTASFRAEWRRGQRLRAPDVESLAFFLVERYCFFTESAGDVSMTRVYHHPWILDEAAVSDCRSSLFSSLELPEPAGTPLAHFSEHLNVQVWPPVLN
jgi:uncharacterized protein YqjF (DUF2071 family)